MYTPAVLVTLALILAPLGARAADLVVWWEQDFYPQEDAAVREIVAAFEQDSGKRVELTQYSIAELSDKIEAALAAGLPPDFAFGLRMVDFIPGWASDDRLVDLTDTRYGYAEALERLRQGWKKETPFNDELFRVRRASKQKHPQSA